MSSNSEPIPNMSDSEEDPSMGSEATSSNCDDVRITRSKKKKNTVQEVYKLNLPEHVAAYMEDRHLVRNIKPVKCNQDIIDKIFGNYIIVKNILSHLHWQDKLICNDVSPLWESAVKRLQLEQLGPVDFSINAGFYATREGVVLLKSSEFYTTPMAVFTFCSTMGMRVSSIACGNTKPRPCPPPCDKGHSILDFIHRETTAPEDCMYAVKACSMSYMPLPHSPTLENMIEKPLQGSDASVYGIFIPQIPGVEFVMVNMTTSMTSIQEKLMPLIEEYTIKGVVACLTENYLLYVENEECLDFLHKIQPNTPFAFGGCLIEETANSTRDLANVVHCVNKNKEFISGNVLSLGLFVTPKRKEGSTVEEPSYNFETYSFVMESTEWSKQKIKQAIQEFSERVPRFEHSVALKFSCVGRQHKHDVEQQSFRAFFPHTRLVGCFGNGELGVNYPPTPQRANKRPKKDPTYEKVHSYSTVFFYIGWGKITKEAQRDK